MSTKLEAHSTCEHGQYAAHPLDPDQPVLADGENLCRGGSSRLFTPNYIAAARQQCAYWPGSNCWKGHVDGVKAIVDAALSPPESPEVPT